MLILYLNIVQNPLYINFASVHLKDMSVHLKNMFEQQLLLLGTITIT